MIVDFSFSPLDDSGEDTYKGFIKGNGRFRLREDKELVFRYVFCSREEKKRTGKCYLSRHERIIEVGFDLSIPLCSARVDSWMKSLEQFGMFLEQQ